MDEVKALELLVSIGSATDSQKSRLRYLKNRDEKIKKSRERYLAKKDEINKKRREAPKSEEFKQKERERLRKYKQENRDHVNKISREWCEQNRDKRKQIQKKYRMNNDEKIREMRRDPEYKEKMILWRMNNKLKPLSKDKKRKWARNNYHKIAWNNKMRRESIKLATIGGDMFKDEIMEIYKKCREITKETGIKHDTDHIAPIKNDNICGLNVPWNLRIVPFMENRKKSNKLDTNLILS